MQRGKCRPGKCKMVVAQDGCGRTYETCSECGCTPVYVRQEKPKKEEFTN